jgi:hypothetical protein
MASDCRDPRSRQDGNGKQNLILPGPDGQRDVAIARLTPTGARYLLRWRWRNYVAQVAPTISLRHGVGRNGRALISGETSAGGRSFFRVKLTGSGVPDPSYAGTGLSVSDIPGAEVGGAIALMQNNAQVVAGSSRGCVRIDPAGRRPKRAADPHATSTPSPTPAPTLLAANPTANTDCEPGANADAGAESLRYISTRLRVETGDNVLIGGFVITGSTQKRIIIRRSAHLCRSR